MGCLVAVFVRGLKSPGVLVVLIRLFKKIPDSLNPGLQFHPLLFCFVPPFTAALSPHGEDKYKVYTGRNEGLIGLACSGLFGRSALTLMDYSRTLSPSCYKTNISLCKMGYYHPLVGPEATVLCDPLNFTEPDLLTYSYVTWYSDVRRCNSRTMSTRLTWTDLSLQALFWNDTRLVLYLTTLYTAMIKVYWPIEAAW